MQVVELDGVVVEHQYFGWAIVETPSIDLEIANSLGVVAIGSAGFVAIGYSVG